MTTFERLHGIFPNTPAATVQLFFIVTKSVQEIQTFYKFKLQTMDRNIEIWANNLPRRVCTLEKRLLLCWGKEKGDYSFIFMTNSVPSKHCRTESPLLVEEWSCWDLKRILLLSLFQCENPPMDVIDPIFNIFSHSM